jgi:hypothetical protein
LFKQPKELATMINTNGLRFSMAGNCGQAASFQGVALPKLSAEREQQALLAAMIALMTGSGAIVLHVLASIAH